MEENPAIAGFVKWFETLGKTGVHRVSQFTARDVRCRTPELESAGPDGVAGIYAAIFENAQSVKIRVSDVAYGRDGFTAYLRWDRLVTDARGRTASLTGVTELTLGTDGKIVSILEYWNDVPGPRGGFFSKLFGR